MRMAHRLRTLAAVAFIGVAAASTAGAERIRLNPVRYPPLAVLDETQAAYVERLSATVRAVDCDRDGLDAGDIALVMKAREGRREPGSALPGACFPLSRSPYSQRGFGEPQPPLASVVVYGADRSTYYDFHGLMRTGPGRDGRITDAEVRRLARQTFRQMDRNGDGKVEADETEAWNVAACGWPTPGRNDTILLVGVHGGQQLSTVSVAGQDRVTELIDVKISRGVGRLYIIAVSSGEMVWRVSGATGRVSAFVASSGQDGDTDQPAAGVAGLAPGKAYVLPRRDCWRGQTGVTPSSAQAGSAAVLKALGRSPAKVIEIGDGGRLMLPEGVWSDAARAPDDAPEGFDQTLWQDATGYWPGGLATPKIRSIVSRERAEPYVVLPAGFGIAQLTGQGLIERLDTGDLRIVKPIPRYPAGLGGGHSVRFRLAPGIAEPPGYSVHSSVVDDLTGKPLFNPSMVCRQPRCG